MRVQHIRKSSPDEKYGEINQNHLENRGCSNGCSLNSLGTVMTLDGLPSGLTELEYSSSWFLFSSDFPFYSPVHRGGFIITSCSSSTSHIPRKTLLSVTRSNLHKQREGPCTI